MARAPFLPEIKAGLGVESACFYCRVPVILLTKRGQDVAVNHNGTLHRTTCQELRRRHRKRQRARRRERQTRAAA